MVINIQAEKRLEPNFLVPSWLGTEVLTGYNRSSKLEGCLEGPACSPGPSKPVLPTPLPKGTLGPAGESLTC